MKVFAVYDAKASQYGNPVFLQTRGVALRVLSDLCAKADSPLYQHPVDYTLFELGDWDCNSGKFKCHPEPVFIFSASDIVNQLMKSRGPKPELLPPDIEGKEVE